MPDKHFEVYDFTHTKNSYSIFSDVKTEENSHLR